jgi:hypothetical protein
MSLLKVHPISRVKLKLTLTFPSLRTQSICIPTVIHSETISWEFTLDQILGQVLEHQSNLHSESSIPYHKWGWLGVGIRIFAKDKLFCWWSAIRRKNWEPTAVLEPLTRVFFSGSDGPINSKIIYLFKVTLIKSWSSFYKFWTPKCV